MIKFFETYIIVLYLLVKYLSGTRRLAPNFLASSEFLRCKFKFLRGVSEFSRVDYHFKLFSTWPTRWLSV